MRSLQIVENTPQQLVAMQTPYTASFLLVLGILVALGFCGWFALTRQWRLLVIPGIALVVLGSLAFTPNPPTYHLKIDKDNHRLTSEARRGESVVSSFTVSGTELSSADMQSNRGATNIVLLRHDGSQLFPLGEQQLQGDADQSAQYVVLTALRDVITPKTNPH